MTRSIVWPANASTARWHWLQDVGWGGKKVSRCEVKPHSLLALWKIFLLRNGAQVVWSVKIPKLKHCGSRSSVVCESDWFAGDKEGPNGTSQMGERVLVGVQKWFTHVYLLSAYRWKFIPSHASWTCYYLLKLPKRERKTQADED